MGKLRDGVALITVSSRGVGRSHALLMAREGADVIVHDIDAKLARGTVDEVRKNGGKAHEIVCEVSDIGAMAKKIADAENAIGGIDVLVNNAGIDTPGTLEEVDEAAYNRMFDIHVKGSFFATRATAMLWERSSNLNRPALTQLPDPLVQHVG